MITFIVALLLGFILGRAIFGPRPYLLSLMLPIIKISTSLEPFAALYGVRIFRIGPVHFAVTVDRQFD